jgi:1-acyl-sn-glycerol-3-phosphate acyltransferase
MSRTPWPISWTPDLAAALTARLTACPRRPDVLVRSLRSIGAAVLRSYLKTYHRIDILGQANLPMDGRSFAMVANHASHLDALCLLSALPREALDRAYPVAADDYFFATLPRLAAAAIFINAIPFGRQSHVRSSMDRCRQLLRERGNILIIFPEGTRSTTGQIAPFRAGIGNLLAGLDVPAVPCAIIGSQRAMSKGTIIPRPRKLRLIIGKPRSFADVEPRRDASHAIARQLQTAVEDLLCA